MLRFTPIVWLALSIAGGILTADMIDIDPAIAAVILLAIIASLIIFRFVNQTLPFILAILIFYFAGITTMSINKHALDKSLLAKMAGEKKYIGVSAVLIDDGVSYRDFSRLEAKVTEVRAAGRIWRLKEKTYIYVDKSKHNFKTGDIVNFKGLPRLMVAGDRLNSDKDYERFLLRKGISADFRVDEADLKVAKGNSKGESFKIRIREKITKFVPKSLGGILAAILIGDTNKVSDETMRTFEKTGLLHLFAVSGLNVTLNVAFIFFLCRIAKSSPLTTLLLTLTSIGFFVWLVGGGASVNRAALMASILLIAWYIGRRVDILATISITAMVMLAVDPDLIFDISFMLSFGAVLGIVTITPVLVELFEEEIRPLVIPAAVAIGAQLAVQPVLAYYFNQLSVIGVVANIFIVPPVAAVTTVGFVATLISLISDTLASPLFKSLIPLLYYIKYGALILSRLPGASTSVSSPSALSVAAYIMLLISAIHLLGKRERKLGFGSYIIIIMLIVSLGFWIQVPSLAGDKELRVTFFDVGQGDATLVRSPSGKVILIDGGSGFDRVNRLLIARGIKKIDLMILSHAHLDHVNGLIGIIQKYPVGEVIDSGFSYPSFVYERLLEEVDKRDVNYQKVLKGDQFKLDELTITILAPEGEFISGSNSDVNNASIVSLISFNEFDLLLPGDIEREAIGKLLDGDNDISAEVLKVSHHGSGTGTTREFLDSVDPIDAVISVGAGNSYGHPHRSALNDLRMEGVRYWRTDRDSSVEIESDGKQYRIWSVR